MRWCWLHNWLKWSEPITVPTGIIQVRVCCKCGVIEKRWVVQAE